MMNWAGTVGAATGSLLPTGAPVDQIVMEDGRRIAASCCDAANPCVWVRGGDFGLHGTETQDAINGNLALGAELREARAKAAVLFGFVDDWRTTDRRAPGLPMIGLLSPAVDYVTINGEQVGKDTMDLRLHLIFMGLLHESVAGTGSICLAAASRIPGSVAYELTDRREGPVLRIGHPSGVTPALVQATQTAESPFVRFDTLGFSRTARRLMDGRGYVPRAMFDAGAELHLRPR